MTHGQDMFHIFDISCETAASGRGLCDFDRVQLGVPRKNIKNLGSPCEAELNLFLVKWENSNYRFNFTVPGLLNFLIFFWGSPNYTLSISHSLRPLTAGPIRIAEIIESPLVMARESRTNLIMKSITAQMMRSTTTTDMKKIKALQSPTCSEMLMNDEFYL